MKKILAAIALCIAILSVSAQSLSIETVFSLLSSSSISKGKFDQTRTISAIGRELKSSGTFIFCAEGIVWQTEKPVPSTLVVGNGYMIQKGADGQKTVTDTSGNGSFTSVASAIQAIFSNSLELLNDNFSVSFKDEGKGNWSANLLPKDSVIASAMSSIVLGGTCSSSICEMTSVLISEANGDTVLYALKEQVHPKELSSDEKEFFSR